MDPISQQTLLATAGAGAAEGEYVEDVFSTRLWTGNGSSNTIYNGIDLAGEGGMVWGGHRYGTSSGNLDRFFYDTVRGTGKALYPSNSTSEINDSNGINAFTAAGGAGGFSLPNGNHRHNESNKPYASWTFRKCPGFFDIVSYVGNGQSGHTISHNLGSKPGMIWVKNRDASNGWFVYHISSGATKYFMLNNTGSEDSFTNYWNDTEPTATNFTVGSSGDVNTNNHNYIAYLFAHDDQQFGKAADESIIKCGTLTISGQATTEVNLGWEAQWVLIKPRNFSGNWFLFDTERCMGVSRFNWMYANTAGQEEIKSYQAVYPTATGFGFNPANNGQLGNGTYIYMAIRRPHKEPNDATDVLQIETGTGTNMSTHADLAIYKVRDSTSPAELQWGVADRMRGIAPWTTWFTNSTTVTPTLHTHNNATETTTGKVGYYPGTTGYGGGGPANLYVMMNDGSNNTQGVAYFFKRYPEVFDIVHYQGTGYAQSIEHSLGVVPELIIVKGRDYADGWGVQVAALGATKRLRLDGSHSASAVSNYWNDTSPTSSVFYVGSDNATGRNSTNYIGYLFASKAGISKIGSYTGTGSNIDVNCGFSNGARFVMIKRTDAATDWVVFDSTRGIVSGNDPYLSFNNDAAENSNLDAIDPLNSGFTITSTASSTLNASGGNYIYLAIA